MNSHKARHRGRQLPEWMVITVVLSLSVALGMPVAARWRIVHPETPKWLGFIGGVGIGFLMLVGIWLVLGGLIMAGVWLFNRRRKK